MALGGAVAVKQKEQRSRKPRRLKPAAGTSRRNVRASLPTPPKLTAPRPTRLFPRQRLFDLLDRTREDHRGIWVRAPRGGGETPLPPPSLTTCLHPRDCCGFPDSAARRQDA